MLNDADGHGGGNASDYEAREDFDFEAGEQFNEENKAFLQDAFSADVCYWHFSDQSDEADDVGSLRESGPRG